MSYTTMMACGHADNATAKRTDGDIPACVICGTTEVAESTPNLEGREARCSCGSKVTSRITLAFFEFRGEGSNRGMTTCIECSGAEVLHRELNPVTGRPGTKTDHEFKPNIAGWEFDSYYCGCYGWD
jgi:hypothetical protein